MAEDLSPCHPEGDIRILIHMTLNLIEETRPSGSRFELGAAIEEGILAPTADVNTYFLSVQKIASKGKFSTLLSKDIVLLIAEFSLPFRV